MPKQYKINVLESTRMCVVCHPDGKPNIFKMTEKDGSVTDIPTEHRVPKFYEGPCLMQPASKRTLQGA